MPRTRAGEIARLKAALATFEQHDGQAGGLKDSKIALKARLGSAQAQADQQAATIAKLRAELAATHERLARQAAHFMGEMRRIGTAVRPRRPQVRLGERGATLPIAVAQAARAPAPASKAQTSTPAPRPTEAKARRFG
jgi:phage-related tail protein